ncbi:hypothetical protein [Propylenella binzhouense]|uniref:Uncharacterized protein n=1 Tax=Propylenella binzhouense TaxID=2555902 RepID=A0A964T555_9HYPH|nr:hypothetical protein [Propylenella binzhouense]MYZ48092.1 hypothetical protein [Propylenella binzhouense]
MPSHAFKVGQKVLLSGSSLMRGAAGTYKIVALLPEERGDWQYRVQSTDGNQQRVVWQSQLAPA